MATTSEEMIDDNRIDADSGPAKENVSDNSRNVEGLGLFEKPQLISPEDVNNNKSEDTLSDDSVCAREYEVDVEKINRSLEEELRDQEYSKKTMLDSLHQIFPGGILHASSIEDDIYVDLKDRCKLSKEQRRSHLAVKRQHRSEEEKRKLAKGASRGEKNGTKLHGPHDERTTPWQWPAEWPQFATLSNDVQQRSPRSPLMEFDYMVSSFFRRPHFSRNPDYPLTLARKRRNNLFYQSEDSHRPWKQHRGLHAGPRVDYTSVIMRNVPNEYTRNTIMEKLNCSGFAGDYDFLYLPYDSTRKCNTGKVIINFCDVKASQRFIHLFHDAVPSAGSRTVFQVEKTTVQGKNASVQHVLNTTPRDYFKNIPDWMPLVFDSSKGKDRGRKESDKVQIPLEWRAWKAMTDVPDRNAASEELTNAMITDGCIDFTTVMLKNIPNKYTGKMLYDRLNENFKDEFDFVYTPTDFLNRCNVGYAFINFRTTNATKRFVDMFHKVECSVCLQGFNSAKVCEVTQARLQGVQANIDHLKHGTALLDRLELSPEWRPIVLDENGDAKDIFLDGATDNEPVAEPISSEKKSGGNPERQRLRAEAPTFVPTPNGRIAPLLFPCTSSLLRPNAPSFIPNGTPVSSPVSTADSSFYCTDHPSDFLMSPHSPSTFPHFNLEKERGKGKAMGKGDKEKKVFKKDAFKPREVEKHAISSQTETDTRIQGDEKTAGEVVEPVETTEPQKSSTWSLITSIFTLGMFRGLGRR